MILKNKWVQLCIAISLGLFVFFLPRPEGTKFKISGDSDQQLLQHVSRHFKVVSTEKKNNEYILEAVNPGQENSSAGYLKKTAEENGFLKIEVDYVDGLSPKAKRFLAVLVVLIFLFVAEPIPLEITAICIGVTLAILDIVDIKGAWAPYMHPVVVFIMCCLIFAISLDKAGITKRLGYYIIKKAGNSVVRFTFILSIGLGLSSGFLHDAAACAIGIVTMLPLMRAAEIEPNSKTAKFMFISLAFACSCGGMGTLIGGGRCMVAAAFLKEFTGIEITFFDWILYAMPAAILTVPISILIVYIVFRPDKKFKLPDFSEEIGPWSPLEKKALVIVVATFALWLTKELHGIHYSATGMLGVAALVLAGVLKWDDIHENLEWGTALFIFGGGISLGLAMDIRALPTILLTCSSRWSRAEGGFCFLRGSPFSARW